MMSSQEQFPSYVVTDPAEGAKEKGRNAMNSSATGYTKVGWVPRCEGWGARTHTHAHAFARGPEERSRDAFLFSTNSGHPSACRVPKLGRLPLSAGCFAPRMDRAGNGILGQIILVDAGV